MKRQYGTALALLTAVSMADAAVDVDLALKAMDHPAGLVVHVGTADGAFEAALARDGKRLVHGLALDDDARDKARAAMVVQGVHPLASAMTWSDRSSLPYAANSVNLLVIDRDALGAAAPAPQEALRVVAPFGAVLEKTGGTWKTTRKPRLAEMDDWTHFDYGPDGATCSADKAVKPIRQLQWISQAQPNPWEGNPAGYSPGGGVRIWGRYAVLDMEDRYAAKDPAGKEDTWSLQCRDAFNGTPVWTIRRGRFVGTRRWSLVADQGMVFAYLKPGGNLAALDIGTGAVKHEFAGTAGTAKDQGRPSLFEETHCVRVAGDKTVVAAGGVLRCFQTQTGKELWQVAREGMLLLAPSVDASRGRVYVIMAQPRDRWLYSGRWPAASSAHSVAALDLATGKLQWENVEMASVELPGEKGKATRRGIGQLLPVQDKLVVWGSAAISGGERPFVATLDASTGKTLYSDDEPIKRNYNVAAYNVLRQNGKVFFAGAFMNIWQYDPATGKTDRVLNYGWNQRCTRFTATTDYLLFGQLGFYSAADFSGEQVTAVRSGCAIGSFPANGLVYSTANACGCITQLRGFNAMTGQPVPPPLPDDRRLVTSKAGKAPPLPPQAEVPAGEVTREWTKQWRVPTRAESPRADGAGVDILVLGHQQRVEGRRGSDLAWTFLADARISGTPLVQGERVYFGDHAGWVYALGAADGVLAWKYLAAPSHRLIVSNGQLESAWPVYGVGMLDGKPGEKPLLLASAGTHSAVGGGVSVVALDPATGRGAWRKTLHLPPNAVPPGGGRITIIDHAFMNSAPKVDGTTITLGDGGRKGGGFTFDAGLPEQALNAQLAAPPKKK